MAVGTAELGAQAPARRATKRQTPPGGVKTWAALGFLLPALLALGSIVVYPMLDTVVQSFQNDDRTAFVGLDNYQEIAENDRIKTAVKNTFLWVVIVPALVTGTGLIVAVLTEKVSYGTALKVVLFMPLAISALSTGVIWRIMYEVDPNRGLVNALVGSAYDVFKGPGPYPGATPGAQQPLVQSDRGVTLDRALEAGDSATVGLTAILEGDVPPGAREAEQPQVVPGEIAVLVWRDFKPGGGKAGVVESGEVGLPGAMVELLDGSGGVVGTQTTDGGGNVAFQDVGGGPYRVRVGAQTFSEGFQGVDWLGPALVTAGLIFAFFWTVLGFGVVVIGAGLAALPRDLLEAARVDGANEWQVFRRITFPLMMPVLTVVFVSQLIGVLKIFDLVYVTAPNSVQDEANVIALEMFQTSFTARRYGVGSAVAVLLFVLVIPAMIFNLRRFKREQG